MRSMFQMTIEAKCVNEFKEKILNLAKIFNISLDDSKLDQSPGRSYIMLQNEDKAAPDLAIPSSEKVTEIQDKRKNLKKQKPENLKESLPQSEISKTVETATEAVEPAAKTFTREDAVAALQELNIKKGLPAAREVLKMFDCVRISEVKVEQYCDFVTACKNHANS